MSLQRVRIVVAEWEIGCCAPPPVLGEPTSWLLELVASGTDPLLDEEQQWAVDVEDASVLRRGAVTARWSSLPEPAPTGLVWLRGRLWGTVHADGIPWVTGRVERLRTLRQEYREVADRRWEPVPGTVTATDVAEYPGPSDDDRFFGVLLDVAVRPDSAPPRAG